MQMKPFKDSQACVPKHKNLQILPMIMPFTGQQLSIPGLFKCKHV